MGWGGVNYGGKTALSTYRVLSSRSVNTVPPPPPPPSLHSYVVIFCLFCDFCCDMSSRLGRIIAIRQHIRHPEQLVNHLKTKNTTKETRKSNRVGNLRTTGIEAGSIPLS